MSDGERERIRTSPSPCRLLSSRRSCYCARKYRHLTNQKREWRRKRYTFPREVSNTRETLSTGANLFHTCSTRGQTFTMQNVPLDEKYLADFWSNFEHALEILATTSYMMWMQMVKRAARGWKKKRSFWKANLSEAIKISGTPRWDPFCPQPRCMTSSCYRFPSHHRLVCWMSDCLHIKRDSSTIYSFIVCTINSEYYSQRYIVYHQQKMYAGKSNFLRYQLCMHCTIHEIQVYIRSRSHEVVFLKDIRIILMHFILGVNKCFKMGRNENRFMKNIVQI